MWPAAVRYAPLQRPGACCEACGRAYTCGNGAVLCERCKAVTCRKCFSRSCAFEIGGTIVALPLVSTKHGVCDGCLPEADREASFRDRHFPFLTSGLIVQKTPTGALASLLTVAAGTNSTANEPVMLQLDVSGRKLTWRSMQLVNQQPKETGDIPLADIGSVVPISASGEPIAGGGGSAGGSSAQAVGLRLVSVRNNALLIVTCSDSRQAKRLLDAVSEAVAVSRLPHCAVFPTAGSAAATAAAEAAVDRRLASSAEARAKRAKEREAFRKSLGTVGMSHTARIMAGGSAAVAGASDDDRAPMIGGNGGGGTSGPSASASGGVFGASNRVLPPPSGASAAVQHSIRTGNIDADRVLNSAVSGLFTMGSSAKTFLSGFSKPPPPAPGAPASSSAAVAPNSSRR